MRLDRVVAGRFRLRGERIAYLTGMNGHEDLPITSELVPADAWGLEPLLDVAELAAYLGVPVSTIYDWPSGRYEARTRYRDWDGCSRIVQAIRRAVDGAPGPRITGGSMGLPVWKLVGTRRTLPSRR